MNYSSRLVLMFALVWMLSFTGGNTHGQTDSLKTNKTKLSKNDRIWLLAYDDTTRAIATLFLVKRKISKQRLRNDYFVAGISAALFVTGGILILTGDQSNDPESYASVPMILGAFGLVGSGLSIGINLLWITPYTLRKL